jgi:hypothetical protein
MDDALPISLHDLVGRGVRIEWDEAVAVIEELCAVVTASGPERPVPDVSGIFITHQGTVALSGGGERGASGVGRTLHALLSSTNVPMPLRLFVTQSTAPEAHKSVREFAAALGYFAKPGRVDLIRGLYLRAAAAVASSPQAPLRHMEPPPRAEKRTPTPARQRSRARIVLGAAACFVLGFVVGPWMWSAAPQDQSSSPLPVLAATAKSVAIGVGTEVRGALGLGAPKVDRVDPLTSAPAAPPTPPSVKRPVASPTAPTDAALLQPEAAPPVAVAERAPNLVLEDVTPPDVGYSKDSGVSTLPDATNPPDVIYSAEDTNVQPPKLTYPQALSSAFSDPRQSRTNTLEVLVSEDGTVEHVRLLDGPRRLSDVMLLSGAKAWQFEPAMNGDTPVRYRTILRWASVP